MEPKLHCIVLCRTRCIRRENITGTVIENFFLPQIHLIMKFFIFTENAIWRIRANKWTTRKPAKLCMNTVWEQLAWRNKDICFVECLFVCVFDAVNEINAVNASDFYASNQICAMCSMNKNSITNILQVMMIQICPQNSKICEFIWGPDELQNARYRILIHWTDCKCTELKNMQIYCRKLL